MKKSTDRFYWIFRNFSNLTYTDLVVLVGWWTLLQCWPWYWSSTAGIGARWGWGREPGRSSRSRCSGTPKHCRLEQRNQQQKTPEQIIKSKQILFVLFVLLLFFIYKNVFTMLGGATVRLVHSWSSWISGTGLEIMPGWGNIHTDKLLESEQNSQG